MVHHLQTGRPAQCHQDDSRLPEAPGQRHGRSRWQDGQYMRLGPATGRPGTGPMWDAPERLQQGPMPTGIHAIRHPAAVRVGGTDECGMPGPHGP